MSQSIHQKNLDTDYSKSKNNILFRRKSSGCTQVETLRKQLPQVNIRGQNFIERFRIVPRVFSEELLVEESPQEELTQGETIQLTLTGKDTTQVEKLLDRESIDAGSDTCCITTYLSKIKQKILLKLPEDLTSSNTNQVAKEAFDEYLEQAVSETVKEALPFRSVSESNYNYKVYDTLLDVAKQAISAKEILEQHIKQQTVLVGGGGRNSILQECNQSEDGGGGGPALNTGKKRRDSFIINLRKQAQMQERDFATRKPSDDGVAGGQRRRSSDAQRRKSSDSRRSSSHHEDEQEQEVKESLEGDEVRIGSMYSMRSDEVRFSLSYLPSVEMEQAQSDPEILAYLTLEKLAENIVRDVIDVSKGKVEAILAAKSGGENSSAFTNTDSVATFVEAYGSFDSWPTIGEFTIGQGIDRISDYMATWYYEENWLYDIELTLSQSDACSDYHQYEAKWSIPTKEYPIPQATASVYFTIEVSRVLPLSCLVNVTYKFEGSSYVHSPFQHVFQEEWLFKIMDSKLNFYKKLTF